MARDYSIGSDVWNGLSKVIEEMGELNQVCGKVIGSGGDSSHWSGDMRAKFVEEIADVQAALKFFMVANLTEEEIELIVKRRVKKFAKFCKWDKAERAKNVDSSKGQSD